MSDYRKRTPSGKWGKSHEADFDVSCGICDITKPAPHPLKSVRFTLGDLMITLDTKHIDEINRFIAQCNERPTKW